MKILLTLLLLFSIPVQAREVTFSWEPIEGASSYEIAISRTIDFKKPLFQEKTEEPTLTRDIPMGSVVYRVRAISAEKIPGYWSEPMKVDIKPYPPELTEPKNEEHYTYYEIPPKITLEWKPQEGHPTYEVFIYKTTGKKVFEKRVDQPEIKVDEITEGDYQWKVKTIYDKIYESRYSEARKITIEKIPIPAPQLVRPEIDQSVPAYRPVQFEWRKDPATTSTDLKLTAREFRTEAPISVPTQRDLKGTETEIKSLEPGTYSWSVTTKEAPKTPGVSSPTQNFLVRNDIIQSGNYQLNYGYFLRTQDIKWRSTRSGAVQEATDKSSGLLQRINANYFITTGWGFQGDIEGGTMRLDRWDLAQSQSTLTMRFRFGMPGSDQQFYLGYREATVYEIIKAPTSAYNVLSTRGFVTGLRLNGTVIPRWRLNLDFTYYKPADMTENTGTINADHLEAYMGLSWNAFYKFWAQVGARYGKDVYSFIAKDAPSSERSEWTSETIDPLMLSIAYEY